MSNDRTTAEHQQLCAALAALSAVVDTLPADAQFEVLTYLVARSLDCNVLAENLDDSLDDMAEEVRNLWITTRDQRPTSAVMAVSNYVQ